MLIQVSGEMIKSSSTGSFDRAITAYESLMRGSISAEMGRGLRDLPGTLEPGEDVISLGMARYTGLGSDGRRIDQLPSLIAFTSRRLIVADQRNPRHGVELDPAEWKFEAGMTAKGLSRAVTLRRDQDLVYLTDLAPPAEAGRILTALGLEVHSACYEKLDGFPRDPGSLPIGAFGDMALYPDRLIDSQWHHLPFSGPVDVNVDTAGNLAVTRGRNLAHKAVGTALFGLPGMLLFGNAREHRHDVRELYLLVEGPNWGIAEPFHPDVGAELRAFAQAISLAAKQRTAGLPGEGDPPAGGLAAELRELAALRDDGILTDDEFEAQKRRLLERG